MSERSEGTRQHGRAATPETPGSRSPLGPIGRAVAGAVVVVGLGLLAAAPAPAQVGGPVGPGSTTTTTEADPGEEPSTSTTTEVEPADEPTTTTAAGADDPEEQDEQDGALARTDDDDGGTSIVALGAVGLVAFLVGLAVAGLPLLAALSKRKAAAGPGTPGPGTPGPGTPGPVPPPAPTPAPAATPAPTPGGPVIGAPPARDTDHVRSQRVALVEAMIALRDKLPSEALAAEVAEALAGAGITELRPEGQPFDPALHRAVHQVATDDPARHGTVASVERPGYTDGTTIIRQPEVVVAVHGSPS